MIDPTAILRAGVRLGDGGTVGAFCIIGEVPRGKAEGALETLIGPGATIRSHSVVYAGNRIGRKFQTGHGAMVREENEIGDDVSIGTNSVVEHHVVLGDRVRLHSNVFVPEYSVLEHDCWIGPNVVVTNARYPQSPSAKTDLRGAHVEAFARIGANCTLLPGVRIGRNALVGAGSVVVRDVAPGEVVAGNPARKINRIENLPYSEP
jgi:acetyltransferase-like isoleucine patch superfamily enzyme